MTTAMTSNKSGGGGLLPFEAEGGVAAGGAKAVRRGKGLRVYVGTMTVGGSQARAFIAAGSTRQVALESDNTEGFVRSRWSETTDEALVKAATAAPGRLFYCLDASRADDAASYAPLPPRRRRDIEKNLRALVAAGFQKLEEADIEKLADAFERMMSFFDGFSTAYVASVEPLEFQGVIDLMLFQIGHMGEGDKIRFLEHVGRPLTNDEMVRYFFGL